MKIEIKKSVREFVEIIMKSGSLDNRLTTNARAIEGVRAHQKLQKSNEELYSNYEKEVSLKINIDRAEFQLYIEGRCDGIIIEGTDVIIEEIKSTYKPLGEINRDFNEMHWAQAKIYAYIYSIKQDLDKIFVQLSYYNLDSNEVKTFRQEFKKNELEEFFYDLIDKFSKLAVIEYNHKSNRNESIEKITFPFEEYRKGQLELVKACYGTIREKKKLFVQAPTGIGKTVSTIFPSVKAIANNMGDRIFYLTAKNVNKKVAEDTFELLRKKGLVFRTVALVAKEKICLNDKVACNPEECPYARNYYNKMKDAIFEILKGQQGISREILVDYGKRYEICPFELSLDLVNWSDGIICDYNYIFDPRVYLRRVLDENGENNIVLVDEAHNLVNRGRDMYTTKLFKSKFLEMSRQTRGKYLNLNKYIKKINKLFIEERHNCESEDKKQVYTNDLPKELCKALRIFLKEAEEVLTQREKAEIHEKLLELYFECNQFLAISEQYDDEYVTYVEIDSDEVSICLFCVDPAKKLDNTMKKCRAVIVFSATLSPFEYFIKMLGGEIDDYRLRLKSPFPKENLHIYLYPANMRYNARDRNLKDVCKRILSFISKESGNYIVFSPSYDYMNKLYNYITEEYNIENLIMQKADMSEEEKEEFLNNFTETSNSIALCVMGGVFSEGIDLPGRRLIGTVIIGVGYPKITFEGEIIKEYFKNEGERVAYIYPGINKVMQAVGRVIRTEQDRGRVLLIDDRYRNRLYSELLPVEWKPITYINNAN